MLSALSRTIWNPDLAVDFGTATTRVGNASRTEIYKMSSMSGSSAALREGVVVDREAAASVLRPLFAKIDRIRSLQPRTLVCAPTDISEEEREALIESVRKAGASRVFVVSEPIAAAIGAGVDVSSPYPQLLVDIGEGVTDCAVLKSGELVASSAVRVACSKLHAAVTDMAFTRYGLELSRNEAARVTLEVGAVPRHRSTVTMQVEGFSHAEGRHLQFYLPLNGVVEAIEPVVNQIVGLITSFMRELPPAVGTELIESGIHLTGGGALLRGMPKRIEVETHISVFVADEPLETVIDGACQILPTVATLNLWQN